MRLVFSVRFAAVWATDIFSGILKCSLIQWVADSCRLYLMADLKSLSFADDECSYCFLSCSCVGFVRISG